MGRRGAGDASGSMSRADPEEMDEHRGCRGQHEGQSARAREALTLTGWCWGAAWGQHMPEEGAAGTWLWGQHMAPQGAGCPGCLRGEAARLEGQSPPEQAHATPGQAVSHEVLLGHPTAVTVPEAPHSYSTLCGLLIPIFAQGVSFLGAAHASFPVTPQHLAWGTRRGRPAV